MIKKSGTSWRAQAHEGAVWPLVIAEASNGDVFLVSASGYSCPEICARNAETGEELWRTESDLPGCNDLELTTLPDGNLLLAVATEDGVARWDGRTGARQPNCAGWGSKTFWSVCSFSSSDQPAVLYGACHDGGIYRWNFTTGDYHGAPLRAHETSVKAVAEIPDPSGQKTLGSGDEFGIVRRWDSISGSPINGTISTINSYVRQMTSVELSKDRIVFIISDSDGQLHWWDAISGVKIRESASLDMAIPSLAVIRSEIPRLFASAEDGFIREWDCESGQLLDSSRAGISVASLTCANGKSVIATGGFDGTVSVQWI